VRAALVITLIYIVLQLLWYANTLFLVVFLGVLFGLAVSAGVDRLERFGVRRGIGAALIVFGTIGGLVGMGALMAPTLRKQGAELQQRLPQALDKVEAWVNGPHGGLFSLLLSGDAVGGDSAKGAAPSSPTAAAAPNATRAVAAPGAPAPSDSAPPPVVETLKQKLGAQMSGAVRYLFPFLSSTFAVFGALLIVLFLAIYIGAEPDLYYNGLLHLIPHDSRARVGEVLSEIATVLRKWFVTQLIAMAVIGTVSTVALLLLGVKAAFALGIIAGILEFVPTVGPILSALPAIAMGFLDSPQTAAYVALAYWGIQLLENHILIPLLMKGGMDLPPALTVISQALLALVFGFLGLMVAVPMLATVMVIVQMLYVQRTAERERQGRAAHPKHGTGEPEVI
jgi:predicted PurR-regulated permease PerM